MLKCPDRVASTAKDDSQPSAAASATWQLCICDGFMMSGHVAYFDLKFDIAYMHILIPPRDPATVHQRRKW